MLFPSVFWRFLIRNSRPLLLNFFTSLSFFKMFFLLRLHLHQFLSPDLIVINALSILGKMTYVVKAGSLKTIQSF